jgi:hypothetical protein
MSAIYMTTAAKTFSLGHTYDAVDDEEQKSIRFFETLHTKHKNKMGKLDGSSQLEGAHKHLTLGVPP